MGKTCFLGGGARIRAARGDVPVELIAPGDEVIVVRDGAEVLEPVKWVGIGHVNVAQHPKREEVAPIRVRKGAIADNQPSNDLFLSPEHCLIIDGLCIPVKYLVNGGSITSERDHPPFTYYHIELERHGILLADNTPAESYLDTGNRCWFDNADDPRQLYPDFVVNSDSDRWLTDACAPLAKVPEEVDPIWKKLAERSEQIGFPIPSAKTVSDPDVHAVCDGRILEPLSVDTASYVFVVPAGVKSVSLVSRYCIPADRMTPGQRDLRRLGMCVQWIAIRTNDGERMIAADDPALQQGWNEPEKDGNAIRRWTDGAAVIPWDDVTGSAVMTVHCHPMDEYPVYDQFARFVA